MLDDGVLFVASSEEPWRFGHLRAIDVSGTIPVMLWDAAERVPLPGTGRDPGGLITSDPPTVIDPQNRFRFLFTNLGSSHIPLSADRAETLQGALAVPDVDGAIRLVQQLRGRGGVSETRSEGVFDEPFRLGAISRSSPALVGRSPVMRRARDRVLYAGAEDGLLHAFLVSRPDSVTGIHPVNDPAGGTELWGYLPGSFLPHLSEQYTTPGSPPAAVHLDGSPAVADVFSPSRPGERRHWSTLLAATGTISRLRRSCLFAFDITDPRAPQLLWEGLLPGIATGRTRGALIAAHQGTSPDALFMTTDTLAGNGAHLLAVNPYDGSLLWQFEAAYQDDGPQRNSPPAIPALMDRDDDGEADTVLFGDMDGRLWAVDRGSGQTIGGAPAFSVPSGYGEPIGAGIAVRGRVAIFGTGGAEHADPAWEHALYAVEISTEGSRLLWRFPLVTGEQIWSTPVLDADGNVYVGTAVDYLSHAPAQRPTAGRMIILDRSGREIFARGTVSAVVGSVASAPKAAVAVSVTGTVTRLGTPEPGEETSHANPGVRVLSWRER